jgi:acyl-CoA thioester hydrolase
VIKSSKTAPDPILLFSNPCLASGRGDSPGSRTLNPQGDDASESLSPMGAAARPSLQPKEDKHLANVTAAVIYPWHCDGQGHLNTRHYVGIFDDASRVFVSRLAASEPESPVRLGWADVRNEVDYLSELKAGDVVDISVAVRRIGTKSLTIVAEMRRINSLEAAARMLAVIIRFDLSSRRGVPLSDQIVNAAREWLETTTP